MMQTPPLNVLADHGIEAVTSVTSLLLEQVPAVNK